MPIGTERVGEHGLATRSASAAALPSDARDWRRWPSLAGPGAAAASLGVAAVAISLANPFAHHVTPPCPFHTITGWWCPMCGGTRAVWAAAHGQWRLMLHSNVLFPAVVVAIAWALLDWAGRATGWWHLPVPTGRKLRLVVIAVVVTFTVLRNLPGLGLLAPPAVA